MMEIKDFHLATFSNPYYDFLDNFAQSEYESAKLLGKFYTDYTVAEEMIDRVVAELEQHNISGEAICGDINSEEVFQTIVSAAEQAKRDNPNKANRCRTKKRNKRKLRSDRMRIDFLFCHIF